MKCQIQSTISLPRATVLLLWRGPIEDAGMAAEMIGAVERHFRVPPSEAHALAASATPEAAEAMAREIVRGAAKWRAAFASTYPGRQHPNIEVIAIDPHGSSAAVIDLARDFGEGRGLAIQEIRDLRHVRAGN
jgi:hypothetical protein